MQFPPVGSPVAAFGGRIRDPGGINRPAGLRTGSGGSVWGADLGDSRIQALESTAPVIGSVSSEQNLAGGASALLWAADVTSTEKIVGVWAEISPPAPANRPQADFAAGVPEAGFTFSADSDRWEATCDGFAVYGRYGVAVYAEDLGGGVSMPAMTAVVQTVGPDVYEADDAAASADVVTVNAKESQRHCFHDAGDEDWVKFYGAAGEIYEIKSDHLDERCDTVLVLYDTDGSTRLTNPDPPYRVGDSGGYGKEELISWECPADGVYFVQVRQYLQNDFGADTGYALRVYNPSGSAPGMLIGRVLDGAENGIEGAVLRSSTGSTALTAMSVTGGYYLMMLPVGTHWVTASFPGRSASSQKQVTIATEDCAALNFFLAFVCQGDVTGDGLVTVADAIVSLKVLCGLDAAGEIRDDYAGSGQDIDGDSAAGLAEAVFCLQELATQR